MNKLTRFNVPELLATVNRMQREIDQLKPRQSVGTLTTMTSAGVIRTAPERTRNNSKSGNTMVARWQ